MVINGAYGPAARGAGGMLETDPAAPDERYVGRMVAVPIPGDATS